MNTIRVFRQGLLLGREGFRQFWNWRSWTVGWMLRIGSNAFIWVLLGQMLGAEQKRNFLLIGNAVMAGATGAAVALPAATWERFDGTHALLVAAPSSMVPAIIGRTSVWLFHGIGTSIATFALLAGTFGLRMSVSTALLLPLLVTLVCTSTFGLALSLGAVANVAPRSRNIVQHITVALMMAFCGVSVPVAFWPHWVRLVVQFMPVTHGLAATRLLLDNRETLAILRESMFELLVGFAWLMLSVVTMDRLADAGRIDGSIELS